MPTDDTSPPSNEASIQSVLTWLSQIDQHSNNTLNEQLLRNLLIVRESNISSPHRSKLLAFFYLHTKRLVEAEFPVLQSVDLPAPRRLHQRVRTTQQLLNTLSQDLLNTLHATDNPTTKPAEILQWTMQCLAWHVRFSHFLASPPQPGLWLQLHHAFEIARQARIEESNQKALQAFYLQILLTAIAQPASFNAREQVFIHDFLEVAGHNIVLLETLPADSNEVFWIDPKADFPAHAIARRKPPTDSKVWFFSGKLFVQNINQKIKALQNGGKASLLKLPEYAETPFGQNVLQRLCQLWGSPGKRKFQRRRQSHRALLCSGLEQLWQLFQYPENHPEVSEWMVTNESPDGYAIMHVSGPTGLVHIGEIVAIQINTEHCSQKAAWHVCLVRWVISENPEHLEFGLQVIATEALAAKVFQTGKIATGMKHSLILPKMPPLRPSTAIVVENATLRIDGGHLVAVVDKENLAIHELHLIRREEQTSRIEILNVEAGATR